MLEELKQAVLEGEDEKTRELAEKAIKNGIEPSKILNDALIPAMEIVGKEYEEGKRYIPEMLISAEAMKAAMEVLRPVFVETGVKFKGKVVIGTVEGDLHDIGKNLVAMMLEGAGFEVIDLGVEVPAARFVQAVREHRPDVLGISALLTTTMVHMPDVIEALREAGLRDEVKIIVGGAPVTQEYAEKIGADAYAPDAAAAVEVVKRLIGAH